MRVTIIVAGACATTAVAVAGCGGSPEVPEIATPTAAPRASTTAIVGWPQAVYNAAPSGSGSLPGYSVYVRMARPLRRVHGGYKGDFLLNRKGASHFDLIGTAAGQRVCYIVYVDPEGGTPSQRRELFPWSAGTRVNLTYAVNGRKATTRAVQVHEPSDPQSKDLLRQLRCSVLPGFE